ncbi:tyrosine-type recombinase/integrase [Endozoicomonas sp. ALC066]|uniref:tyrosine-type recombinase/integrase n=1 Tax=Endozoicomonas sp. ALC066 TaxID=3403078 RepID=UPI003BB636C0
MAYIEKRKGRDGKPRWRAVIRKKFKGKIVFRDENTFTTEARAKTWSKRREVELEGLDWSDPNTLLMLENRCETLWDLLDKYEKEKENKGALKPSLKSVIKILKESNMAKRPYNQLTSKDLVGFCEDRKENGNRGKGASGSTIKKDLTILSAVINTALPSWGLQVPKEFMEEAKPKLRNDKLVRNPIKRKRRPKEGELEAILKCAEKHDKDKRCRVKMKDIIELAAETAMRQEEICKLEIEDVNWAAKTVVVRDRKDPESTEGNDGEVALLGRAFDIIKERCEGRDKGKIFPYTARSVSRLFLKLKKQAGVHTGDAHKDLRFHDLRREGASRLLELGLTLEEVSTVTGHKDISTLSDIYSSLHPQKLHNRYRQLNEIKTA